MEYVTVVNRTANKTLIGTWDGKRYEMKPGKHEFPRAVAEAFKRQNPVMGTGMYGDVETLYLIGIPDDGDDCSPIEQSNEISTYPKNQYTLPTQVVQGRNGLFSGRDVQAALPLDSNFVKA